MSDVSITDLIAEARKAAKRADYYQSGEAELFVILADALEVAERDAQTAEDQANNLAGDVVQLEQKLAESVTVPTEKPPVHNHGPAEGRGLYCNESVVDGFLRGACVRVTEQTEPFSQSPHMAAKYWGQLVKARNRIAELEAAAVPVEPEQTRLECESCDREGWEQITEGGTQ
jgi:hypothetical protein